MALMKARQSHGEVVGKMVAIGLQADGVASRDVLIQTVLATSAIEGESLNPDSVRSSVLRKLGFADDIGASPVNRHIDGLVDVTEDATNPRNESLDEDRLLRWHSALFPAGTSGIRRILVGRYREHADAMQIVSGTVGKEVVHYTAPPSAQVKSEMDAFLHWFNVTSPLASSQNGVPIDGFVRAAIAHLWFESIHPFEDGNGRIGRAIMDLAIAQDLGVSAKLYSLSSQLLQHRKSYYEMLNRSQCGNLDVSAWVVWFTAIFSNTCHAASVSMDHAIAIACFWREHEGNEINQRQRKVIQRLLDAGDGGFVGGLSTSKYVRLTSISKPTATRDLRQLLRQNLLLSYGQGKATRYYVNVLGWHSELFHMNTPKYVDSGVLIS